MVRTSVINLYIAVVLSPACCTAVRHPNHLYHTVPECHNKLGHFWRNENTSCFAHLLKPKPSVSTTRGVTQTSSGRGEGSLDRTTQEKRREHARWHPAFQLRSRDVCSENSHAGKSPLHKETLGRLGWAPGEKASRSAETPGPGALQDLLHTTRCNTRRQGRRVGEHHQYSC